MPNSRKSPVLAVGAIAFLSLLALAAPRVAYKAPKSTNAAPVATITAPGTGNHFSYGKAIAIAATASDTDGSVVRVDFYAGRTLLGSDASAPYALSWTPGKTGSYSLKAVALDDKGTKGNSAVVGITIDSASDTIAPAIPVGLAVTAADSASISLQWQASVDNAGGSGIAGYDVYRDGALAGSTASLAYTDSALLAATSHTYAVRARDIAGNASSNSAAIVASTLPAATTTKRVLGYFTQWGIYNSGYTVKSLETNGSAARLTHLAYAFGNVRNNRCEVGVLKAVDPATGEGGDAYADYSRDFTSAESVDGVADAWNAPLRGHWNQLRKLKAKHPGLKVLISLGGWTMSGGFASAARPENRQAFVASCIDAYIRGNLPLFDNAGGQGAAAGVFDGFDIDWEYPATCGLTCGTSDDTANFTGLLAEFRRQLDAIRPGLQLTVAVGAGIDKIRVTRPDLYAPYVDAINLMTYDFHGDWENRTNFHSALFDSPNDPSSGDAALYNSNDAVQALLARGVPAAKINLGMASYGRGWTNVGSTNHGLYQGGVPASGSEEPGVETYAILKTLAWPAYRDGASMARWIYDGKTFWSFDDPSTIADKMDYVQVQGLGGAFLWDFSGDDAQGSLLAAIKAGS
ncbi:MAG TPA: glycosyl hydrolase family 18 protein [Lysobacter sp.]|nr:glycosyl hydrolase family 18 protein [Lysobacter sp.]